MQTLLPFLIILVLFWALLILPQQRRQKRTRQMQSALQVGDTVMLTSGFLGEISGLEDDVVTVRLADGVDVRVIRGAIGQVRNEDAPAPHDSSDDENGDADERDGSVTLDKRTDAEND